MSDEELGPQDIWSAIQSARIAMLTTEENNGLGSRPMASLARPNDGCIYFVTRPHKIGGLLRSMETVFALTPHE
ncbi:MAG: pyridoxamine 5'-phosphate oxidase family protein [Gammaproteobacteria bacterium]|nr:pyridoxamine 5'-phosphate oxidase family protein [Gammaproteobacteria bacterium]